MNPYTHPEPVSAVQVGGTHYVRLDIQPWDAMQAWFPKEHFSSYLLMNAVKYIARDKCNKAEDIEKANHYLEKWLEINR